MDILDIDEVLQGDSFCLMEDSGQDDISNILQQWRHNGSLSAGGKFDTRTFTRPKRRSAQNLEPNFVTPSKSDNSAHLNPNVNLQIGGLVTSMQKSFLQDTSPPSSILSSMDASIDRMNNSLITSGDFTNVSFFNTADVEDVLLSAQIDGYNFDAMIKDRKALESLSLSGDSAIIKDSNIAQIDEITYLSKTNSGNSTMQNSTESLPSGVNETFTMLNQTAIEKVETNGLPLSNESLNKLSKDNWNSVAQDDLICNTTVSLIENSYVHHHSAVFAEDNMNSTYDKYQLEAPNVSFLKSNKDIMNMTFEKTPDLYASTIMNRTYYRENKEDEANQTFDLCESSITGSEQIKNNFDSPILNSGKSELVPHSTPQRNVPVASSQTPSIKSIIKEVNISPIVPVKIDVVEEAIEIVEETKKISNKTIDQFENNWETLLTNFPSSEEQIECFKIERAFQDDSLTSMECFENGVELLTVENNEDEFDDMLEKLGKSSTINESIKMRQSLDNIKKKHSISNYEKNHDLTPKHSETNLDMSRILSDSMGKSSLSSSSSSERLLSRRSRLYDDVQVIKPVESSHMPTSVEADSKAIAKTDNSTLPNSRNLESKTESTTADTPIETAENASNLPAETKVRGERNRDPERFKTIRIFKKPNENESEIVVPCIDGEITSEHPIPYVDRTRFSRKDNNSPNETTVFNNNKSEIEPINNYQTYKKSRNLSKQMPIEISDTIRADQMAVAASSNGKPRSLSRPKYLSGLIKHDFSDVLPKANSASDIHKTYINSSNGTRKLSNLGTFDNKSQSILKSPMGTKAKSFTNLAGPFGFSSKLSMSKPNSQPSLMQPLSGKTSNREKTSQSDRTSIINRPTPRTALPDGVEQNEKQVFKVPHPISNLRPPNSRRTGLMRPSSGFYSHNIVKNDAEIETGRCSPSNSTSSSSSRGSIPDSQQKCTNGYANENHSTSTEEIQMLSDNVPAGQSKALPTTVKTGIPKPSGLRPPSSIRKSGLPRPSSIVRR